ncbi:MAG: Ger(x)C family spore germination C-terminal domain-containing protein, partial [Christensenellales bacterium]|jgi:spore germination protein KC
VFKDNKLAGYMNGNEARAYNLVTETIESSFVAIPSTGKQTVVKIDDSKSDIDAFMEDDQPSFRVNIQAELSIAEESRNIDVSKPDPLKIIEEQFNETIRAEVKAAIYKAQVEFKSDIFGFGRQVQIQHPSQWPAFQENWDDHFSKAPIEVVVESSVYRSGQIKRPLTMED